ncbi:MAG TPA: nucleoside-diphosphate sugar epimerase/dehydratase [Terriglobales bacterium]|nr:nucleoside-diphosphate sugar epimerase/dehydratase [Terriglobales bacterium]
MERVRNFLKSPSVILVYHAALIAISYSGSFLLRFDFAPERQYVLMFAHTVLVVIVLKLLIFHWYGLTQGWWRYATITDLLDLSKAALISAFGLYVLIHFVLRINGFPRSIVPIDTVLTILVSGGARFAVRAYLELVAAPEHGRKKKRTLIVGAGVEGSALVRELRRSPNIDYRPVALVDDNRTKTGLKIYGVPVLGTTERLNEIILKHSIECVLIALSSMAGYEVEQIIEQCQKSRVDFRILPTLRERLNKPVSISQVRNVQVEDLLGRKPVQLDLEKISQRIKGKVVLITGAGGSIGSELACQLAAFSPEKLILLDRAENNLFKISMRLANEFPQVAFVPVIGDILDVRVLRDSFAQHRPTAVFHAAAYKHVPMMERNCFQAVTNNIFGTYNVAMVARQFLTEHFVLISTDKAVRPTNIMGATKRVAELVILGLQHEDTRFKAVRFGNVLGSEGSVLPIFQQQIAARRPVTVTHPEATRYFMTIPEAVQLVLQASTMGNGGEIFVLDMGQPVRVLDLARKVVRLSGLEPDKDIPIIFTGLRPGEKLSEELWLDTEGLRPTTHASIHVLDGGEADFHQLRCWLDELSELVNSNNVHGIIQMLKTIIPEYVPSEELLDISQIDRHDIASTYILERARLAQVS